MLSWAQCVWLRNKKKEEGRTSQTVIMVQGSQEGLPLLKLNKSMFMTNIKKHKLDSPQLHKCTESIPCIIICIIFSHSQCETSMLSTSSAFYLYYDLVYNKKIRKLFIYKLFLIQCEENQLLFLFFCKFLMSSSSTSIKRTKYEYPKIINEYGQVKAK